MLGDSVARGRATARAGGHSLAATATFMERDMQAILNVVEVWCVACEACANMTAGGSTAPHLGRATGRRARISSAQPITCEERPSIGSRFGSASTSRDSRNRPGYRTLILIHRRLWARESDDLDPRQTVENVDWTCQVILQIAGKTEMGDLSQLSPIIAEPADDAGLTPRATPHSTVRASRRRISKARRSSRASSNERLSDRASRRASTPREPRPRGFFSSASFRARPVAGRADEAFSRRCYRKRVRARPRRSCTRRRPRA